MQSLSQCDALKTEGALSSVNFMQLQMAVYMEQMQCYNGLQLPSYSASPTSRSKALEERSRSWLSSVKIRPMQRKDLETVHPDQIQFFPSSHWAAEAAIASSFAMPKIHASGFQMPDTDLTPYAERELLLPAIKQEQPWLMSSLSAGGGVERVAATLPAFSDSEDSSSDITYSPSFCSTSDGRDSYEDPFGSLDDISGDPFDPAFPTPTADTARQQSVDEIMNLLLDDPVTTQALPHLANFTNNFMALPFRESANGGFLNALNSIQFEPNHELQLPQFEQQTLQTTSSMVQPMVSSQSPGPVSTSPLLREALMHIPAPSSVSSSSQPSSPVLLTLSEGSEDSIRIRPGKSPVTKRRPRAMKEINIDPPQLGASGSASLWEFILELLADPTSYGQFIRWKDRDHGQFKIYDSQVVAALWGKHKNRTNMNFDKMSRAMRYYYGKNILEKGPDGGRLEYEFRPGSQWLRYVSRNLNSHNFVAPNPNQFSDGNGPHRHGRVSRRRSSARQLVRSSSPY